MCSICTGCCPILAEEYFYYNVKQLGGKCIGEYMSSKIKVECICINGHKCYASPNTLTRGGGMCRKCVGLCPAQAEANFRRNMKIFGTEIIGKYKNSNTPIECICIKGHKCYPCPGNIAYTGAGICKECNEHSSEAAEKKYRKSLVEAGFTITGDYVDSTTKVKTVCSFGHQILLLPATVQQKGARCKECNGRISHLEIITSEAFKFLGYSYEEQCGHKKLRRLKFDFKIIVNGVIYYIEADGEQHQRLVPYFHRDIETFNHARQRDLIKNYFVRHQPNTRLIRINHTIYKSGSNNVGIDKVIEYISAAINSKNKIVADHKIYTWIDDDPDIEKYLA